MPRPIDQRVGVFIDVQNMFYAAKHLYGSKLNFARLQDYVARDRPLVRSIAYVVQTPEIDQSNFLAMLRSNGYEIRSKDLKQRPDGSMVSMPLEDMWPFLERDEFMSNMIVAAVAE